MKRETAFVGGLAVVLLAMLVGVTVVPGVVAEPREDVRPSSFDIRQDDGFIRAADVSGSTVTLQIATRVGHRGGVGENVTVEVRAIDSETGLLEDRQETDLGTVDGDGETPVLTNLTVERQGGYRIETFVYEDGRSKASERRSVSGVDSLKPDYARSPVKFQEFGAIDGGSDMRSISLKVGSLQDDRATLNVSTFLTNDGDVSAGDLTLVLTARQAESNVVADESRVQVGSIRPGRTATTATELTVPNDYNYWLDAILLNDGVVVDTASEPANLDPQQTLEKDERQTDTGFQAEDFSGTEQEYEEATSTPVPTGGSGPGFGAAMALVGLVGATLLAARRNQ